MGVRKGKDGMGMRMTITSGGGETSVADVTDVLVQY
jgi:hypothetical protein